jgi:phospholipid/cholesterol/gamma-HCH transport system substrate-binding protein
LSRDARKTSFDNVARGQTSKRCGFEAVVDLEINSGVALQEDCIASIRTAGIIGDKYVSITPGGFDQLIQPGGEITETEAAINIEQLISKYIFEK